MRGWAVAAVAVGLACAGVDESVPVTSEPEVEIFGRGAISTDAPEFAITFSPDGDTAYFNRTPADRSRLDLLVSVRRAQEWSTAVPFPPTEGTSAIDPFMSASGDELYFSSDLESSETSGSFGLWYVRRTGGGWSAPVALPKPVNSDSSDVFNSWATDGLMVFSSRRDGTRRIYSTRSTEAGWDPPTLVAFGEIDDASNPAISPDGSFIVIARRVEGRGPDLFVSCREESGWGELQRLPDPINSSFRELAPAVSNGWLYFTSERPGVVGPQPEGVRPPGDIYRTSIANVMGACRTRG